ncbi:MAG: hypothetical protein R3308_07095 [Thiohalobacterales bacterium]|nr:hypothetical protein [Thiohalobacterales bacterium]
MDIQLIKNAAPEAEAADPLQLLAPRPRTLSDTGLSRNFLAELVAKHLYSAGVLTLRQLAMRIALAGPVLEDLILFLRGEAYIEVRGAVDDSGLRYALTDRGRALALDALNKSGYTGRAPVPLEEYTRIVKAQTMCERSVSQEHMQDVFSSMILKDGLLEQLGPAMHSGRPIFIYGPAGAGKTYVASRLANLFDDSILIPHAIAIGETVIQFFDPVYHKRVEGSADADHMMLDHGHDPRYLNCYRPMVMTGGELTLDMLELTYDAGTRQYHAPLQLKANNGVCMIDDLGRQRVQPVDLLNRWIVPMEERRDFLALGSGEHFPIPFEVVLIFSTNLDPLDLADEAFLRRLGYKIRFDYLNNEEFTAIWRQVCEARGLEFDAEQVKWLIERHYMREQKPMLPCHPRDLLGIALDRARYQNLPLQVTRDLLDFAWQSYFVSMEIA